MSYKTVAVVGASGTLGKPVVQALLEEGFTVTAVSRETSSSTYPDGVEVQRADLASVESLTRALAGQDAVVVCVPFTESGNQIAYVDAAVAAGVKRFIPAEWGLNTRPGKLTEPLASMMAGKTKTVDYLIEQSKLHPELTWTGIATGPFLDFGMEFGIFGIDVAAKTAIVTDSGDQPFSTSSLPFIARAVVAVLRRPEQTANRYIEIAEHTTTQNRLRALVEEATGGAAFTISRTSSADVARRRDDKFARGDWSAFVEALWVFCFADGAGRGAVAEGEAANAELGLQPADLREFVTGYVKARAA